MGHAATAEAWDYWEEEDGSEGIYRPTQPYRRNPQPPSRIPVSYGYAGNAALEEYEYYDDYVEEDELEEYEPIPQQYALYEREWQHLGQNNLPPETHLPYLYTQPRPEKLPFRFPPLVDYAQYYLPRIIKNRIFHFVLVIALGVFLVTRLFGLFNTAQAEGYKPYATGSNRVVAVAPRTGSSVLSAPSISPAKIDEVLRSYKSPAAGVGQAMFDLGAKYGIDPAYALAFFIHESSAGTAGIAVNTKSIGNIRHTPGYENYGGFRKYPTWEAGIEDWYKLIKDLYVNGWKLTTVEQIVPVYAPAADRNNPTAYIQQVNNMVAGWRAGR